MAGATRFVAVDAETTGTNPRRDRIVELFLLEVDSNLAPGRSWHQRFDPGTPIPSDATRVHGIEDRHVQGLPSFKEVACRVQCILSGATLIAYNGLRFDVPLLHEELVRAGQPGLPPDQAVIDPYRLFIEDKPRNLSAAVRHYLGRPHAWAHTADGDVHAMLEVLRAQRLQRGPLAPRLEDLAQRRQDDGPSTRQWLDGARCFYLDPPDATVRLGFGRHRGDPAGNHPSYLQWMLDGSFGAQTKAVAARLLAQGTRWAYEGTRWKASQAWQ